MEKSPQSLIHYFLLIFIFISSCKVEKKIGQENNIGIDRDTKVSYFDFDEIYFNQKLHFKNETYIGEREIEFLNTNGGKYKLGELAKDKNDKITHLKIGLWKSYYDNGQIKEEGEYLIGRYVQCCTGGYCVKYYNYRVGNWNYYYQNGKLKLKGNFEIKKLKIDTSCEGGDYLKFGMLNPRSEFYDSKGARIKVGTETMKLEFEKIFLPDYDAYLVPNSNKTEIEVSFINKAYNN